MYQYIVYFMTFFILISVFLQLLCLNFAGSYCHHAIQGTLVFSFIVFVHDTHAVCVLSKSGKWWVISMWKLCTNTRWQTVYLWRHPCVFLCIYAWYFPISSVVLFMMKDEFLPSHHDRHRNEQPVEQICLHTQKALW